MQGSFLGCINKVVYHQFLCMPPFTLDSFIRSFCVIFKAVLLLGTFNLISIFNLVNACKMDLVSSTSQLCDVIIYCVLLQPAFVTAVPCEAYGVLLVNLALPWFLQWWFQWPVLWYKLEHFVAHVSLALCKHCPDAFVQRYSTFVLSWEQFGLTSVQWYKRMKGVFRFYVLTHNWAQTSLPTTVTTLANNSSNYVEIEVTSIFYPVPLICNEHTLPVGSAVSFPAAIIGSGHLVASRHTFTPSTTTTSMNPMLWNNNNLPQTLYGTTMRNWQVSFISTHVLIVLYCAGMICDENGMDIQYLKTHCLHPTLPKVQKTGHHTKTAWNLRQHNSFFLTCRCQQVTLTIYFTYGECLLQPMKILHHLQATKAFIKLLMQLQ